MQTPGPILLIEDDIEDQHIFKDALKELGIDNEVICFQTCPACLVYMKATPESPFIIFCDVNLPLQNGIDFKRNIDEDPKLREKSIPFIFYSTSTDRLLVVEAYTKMTVQGYFRKKSSFGEIKEDLRIITDYWMRSMHPNNC